jgi:hypothetical protein
MEPALLEKPPVVQLLKNFPTFYGMKINFNYVTLIILGALQSASP